jgi:PAS domain S-box-containing protein
VPHESPAADPGTPCDAKRPDVLDEMFDRGLAAALVVDLAPVPRIRRVNSALRALIGRDVAAGTPVEEVVGGWTRDTGAPEPVEAVLLRADGDHVTVTLRVDRLRGDPGTALVQIDPGGPQRRAERALWESEQRLEAIADAVKALIYLKRTDGRYLLINSFFEREYGVHREDLTGMTDVDIFGATAATAFVANDRRVLAAGHSMQFEEDMPDGGVYLSTKFPLRRRDGELYAVGGISTDITVRSRVERAVRAAKEEAERANQAKSEFLSRMSHELRTPLNSILGFGQLLQLELEGDVGLGEKADRIVQAGRHLLTLINEVLDISRVEHGGQDLPVAAVRAVDAFQDALVLLRPLAAARRIEVARDFHEGLQARVLANPQRLTQVLLNVLSNAVKYNRDGGMVTASFGRADHGRVRFLVTDTGPGLDDGDIDRIFAPFERLHADATDVEGTGLGLTLSKSIVEAMGGTIGVERTKKGRGSVFYLDLPAADETIPDGSVALSGLADEAGWDISLRDVRVLYIEDDEANIELVRQIIARRALAELVCVRSGREGVGEAARRLPDVILLDMHLPEMEGEDVLTALRANDRTADIPVVALSADALPARVERLLAAGASAYLTKPVDVHHLVRTVRAVVDGRQA